jgi:hypothetical protein
VAGLGRKTFVAGDVLTAAQVQGFLQDQAIMVFSGTSARGTGIASPSEGMFSYLTDSNTLTFYDGADWQNFVPSLDNSVINNGTVNTSTFNGGTAFNLILDAPEENFVSTATAAGGTVTVDAGLSGITLSTGTATSNFIINLRANSTATLDSIVNVGDAITHTYFATNGTGVFGGTAVRIDGTAVTTLWQGGSAPTGGNASSVDAYTITVFKTSATPTYVVFGSQTQFKA